MRHNPLVRAEPPAAGRFVNYYGGGPAFGAHLPTLRRMVDNGETLPPALVGYLHAANALCINALATVEPRAHGLLSPRPVDLQEVNWGRVASAYAGPSSPLRYAGKTAAVAARHYMSERGRP